MEAKKNLRLKISTNQPSSKSYLQPTKFLKVLLTDLIPNRVMFNLTVGTRGSAGVENMQPADIIRSVHSVLRGLYPCTPVTHTAVWWGEPGPLQPARENGERWERLRWALCSPLNVSFFDPPNQSCRKPKSQVNVPPFLTFHEATQQETMDYLIFFAGLSGVWERDEAGLEKGDELGPLLFHS